MGRIRSVGSRDDLHVQGCLVACPQGHCKGCGLAPSLGRLGPTRPAVLSRPMHCPQVARSLLAAGAPWNALNRHGKCAGDLALEAGHAEAAEAILEAGATSGSSLAAYHVVTGAALRGTPGRVMCGCTCCLRDVVWAVT